MRYKPGTKVQLSTGGPEMNVFRQARPNGADADVEYVECGWFSEAEYGDWKLRTEIIPAGALEEVDE